MSEIALVTANPATGAVLRPSRSGILAALPGLLLTAGMAGLAFELLALVKITAYS